MSKLKSIEYTAIYFNELRELPEDFFKSKEVKMSEELKGCPWCNEIPKIVSYGKCMVIQCQNDICVIKPCTELFPNNSKALYINSWNLRLKQ